MDYTSYSDDELIEMINSGDEDAEEYLIKKYLPLVKKEVRFLYLAGAEIEDLLQEGMIGLFHAIRKYDTTKSGFSTFATLCVRCQIQTAITRSNRQKHAPLNYYISIYATDEDSDMVLSDAIEDTKIMDPEERILKDEHIREMYHEIDTKLSTVEQIVAREYINGMSYSEIAGKIGKDEKAVNNALTRIRTKLRR